MIISVMNKLILTGEGGIDAQTFSGKTPFGIAEVAKRKGVPIILEYLGLWLKRVANY